MNSFVKHELDIWHEQNIDMLDCQLLW